MADKPSYLNFDKAAYPWRPGTDYRKHPEAYRIGKGEQGVLICEPYKTEIGRHWRFKTEAIAQESSQHIYAMFLNYLQDEDFVGADMARKFLQMGFTRARRYANYKGGKKYDADNNYAQLQRGTGQEEKARAAQVFYKLYKDAEANDQYKAMKTAWKKEKG
ncbi:DUF4385 domain-containing protein [Mucilaginibacter sp.]|uniref:DUF4385 domain-containing protein n=1 Tax=Mucilaginibacter sp. TaxID=1882438 RepID=UPI0035BC56EE